MPGKKRFLLYPKKTIENQRVAAEIKSILAALQ
jgi:hypothetical protein